MQHDNTFQISCFTPHQFISVDVTMSFQNINSLKYPNNAVVIDCKIILINAINFLLYCRIPKIFFSNNFKAQLLQN